MISFRKQILIVTLSFTTLLTSCTPQMADLTIQVATSAGVYLINNIDTRPILIWLEKSLDSMFGEVSETLSDVNKGAIVEDPRDPTGLTGKKTMDVEIVVRTHRQKDFQTESIKILKDDLVFYRDSRDSTAKWELSGDSELKIKNRLDVAAVQISLKSLEIDPGRVDGIWGEETKKALMKFQSQQGLSVTGDPTDDETKDRLFKKE